MHITFTSTAYPPSTGGAQIHAHMLVQELIRSGDDVSVFTHWNDNRHDWLLGTTLLAPETDLNYVVDGVPVVRMGIPHHEKYGLVLPTLTYYPLMNYSLPVLASHTEKRLAALSVSADIVHNVRIGREPLSWASYLLARHRDIPFVFTPCHHPRWVGWRYRAYIDLYRRSDLVLVLTEAERREMVVLGVSSSRICTIGHGPVIAPTADPENFRLRYGIDGPLVLFVGQHYSYKGFHALLKAAPLVWRRFPDARFAFIGPPVGDSEAAYRGADPRIVRLGAVDLQTKTDALAACTVLCVPSTQESFGGVYTEAWSFGKPVIGARIPSVAEVIDDGVDGLLTEQRPAEIADRLLQILGDASAAERMGAAGLRKVTEKYSWNAIVQRTRDAYRRVMGV